MATEATQVTPQAATIPDELHELWAEFPGLTESEFWKTYVTRLQAGRDMHTAITAASETGVGKTLLAVILALLGDVNGWHAGKATLDPAEYAHMYDERVLCEDHADRDERIPLPEFERCRANGGCEYAQKPGSWLIGDEWEQAVDARRSTSKENVEASHQVATKRYRQIMAVYTLPSKSWMDNRFGEDAIDYWIQVHETEFGEPKGEADVYRVKINEHKNVAYTQHVEKITWPNFSTHPEFRKLNQMKKQRMEGNVQRTYIHRDEFEEAKKNFWNKATKKTRYHIVKAMAEYGISQTDIAEITQVAEHVEGISQQRVSQLVNTQSFEDAYKR
ncbi:MAG: hypothetical protein ACOCR6_02790 [archaeon]